jgi:hypothetical protein
MRYDLMKLHQDNCIILQTQSPFSTLEKGRG